MPKTSCSGGYAPDASGCSEAVYQGPYTAGPKGLKVYVCVLHA